MNAYSKKYNYMILWSAKSGCTYLRQLFLELHKEEIQNNPKNKWHNLNSDFKIPQEISNTSEIKKIILCRNPYNRVASIFCNKYCGGHGHSILPPKIQLKKCTFREFVKELMVIKMNGKLNNTDIHICEQTFCYNKNTYLLKLEEFDKSIIDIYTKMDLHILIPEIKSFLNKKNFKNKTSKNLETEYVYDKEYTSESTVFPDYKYFYDDELLNLVYEIYKNDFINFNYKKDSY